VALRSRGKIRSFHNWTYVRFVRSWAARICVTNLRTNHILAYAKPFVVERKRGESMGFRREPYLSENPIIRFINTRNSTDAFRPAVSFLRQDTMIRRVIYFVRIVAYVLFNGYEFLFICLKIR